MNASASDFGFRYFKYLCIVSLTFVAFTVLIKSGIAFPPPFGLANNALQLGWENNLATWWSGSLLLIAGLHAYDGYELNRTKSPRLAYSWLILWLVLTCLSLDEVGSLHERVSDSSFATSVGAWWAIVPFAILLVGAITFALCQLWQLSTHRHHVLLIIVGFGCFAAAAGQEYLEHAFAWPVWLTPVRLAAEEGTELVGMLILIWVAMQNTDGIVSRSSDNRIIFFSFANSPVAWCLPLAFVVAIPFASFTSELTDLHRGRPADWFASAIFLIAAIAAWSSILFSEKSSESGKKGIGILLAIASALCIQISPDNTVEIGTVLANARLLCISALIAAAALLLFFRGNLPIHRYPAYGLLCVASGAAILAMDTPGRELTYLGTTMIALFAYAFAAPASLMSALGTVLGNNVNRPTMNR